jgi:hypothetical protein
MLAGAGLEESEALIVEEQVESFCRIRKSDARQ